MKNTIRCCISCILPCGALDVIRIVHSNGHVEEISGSITASEIMRAHPKHVLKKPSPPPSDDHDVISTGAARGPAGGVVPAAKIVIVPPDAELQRGKIYFLMPVSDTGGGDAGKSGRTRSNVKKRRENAPHRRTHHRRHRHGVNDSRSGENYENNYENNLSLLMSDRYLTEILSEKVSTQRERRRGRVGVWRPHLESISETATDD